MSILNLDGSNAHQRLCMDDRQWFQDSNPLLSDNKSMSNNNLYIVPSSRGVNSHLPIHNRFYGFTSWSRTRTTPIHCSVMLTRNPKRG
ncbi:hypothetical protein TNCV_3867661 [Trichonephila clavipes]|nr:hypothetical protein TNCV_3867661 [Trichonephila clavipes]